jgi:hypothetical protein
MNTLQSYLIIDQKSDELLSMHWYDQPDRLNLTEQHLLMIETKKNKDNILRREQDRLIQVQNQLRENAEKTAKILAIETDQMNRKGLGTLRSWNVQVITGSLINTDYNTLPDNYLVW